MNQRLYAAAQRQGVETRPDPLVAEHYGLDRRPDNDIAMDVLAKLIETPFYWLLEREKGWGGWFLYVSEQGSPDGDKTRHDNIIEAVVALEERSSNANVSL